MKKKIQSTKLIEQPDGNYKPEVTQFSSLPKAAKHHGINYYTLRNLFVNNKKSYKYEKWLLRIEYIKVVNK